MKPVGLPPKKATRTAKANTSNVMPRMNSRLSKERKVNVTSGGEGDFPLDCPMRIEVERVLGPFEQEGGRTVEGLMGHIVDLDLYTKQHNVRIKLYRFPNAFTVEVSGEEVFRWTEGPDDLPVRFRDYLEMKGRADNSFVEQADLQPGDVVEDGEDGMPVVLRVEEPVSSTPRGQKKGPKPRSGKTRKAPAPEPTPEVEEDDDIEWE